MGGYRSRRANLLIICALLLALISGCGQEKAHSIKGSKQVIDATGVAITIPEKPRRIVSLGISADDILVGLVPIERITALTYLANEEGISNVMEAAKRVVHEATANTEAIIALDPDLVLIPDWQPDALVQSMRDVGLSVYVYRTGKNIVEIKDSIMEIAGVVGETESGKQLLNRMDTIISGVAAKVKTIPENERMTGVRYSPMGGSGGKGSTFDDICQYAGVNNAAAIAGVSANGTITKEQIVKTNPDFFLLPTWDYSGKLDLAHYKEEVLSDSALQSVKAIQERRLYQVPDKYLFCTSQNVAEGVRMLAETVYPQVFAGE